jgi:hypothetical protein
MQHYILDVHIADGYYVNYGDADAKDAPQPERVYRIGTGVGDNELQAFGAFNMPTVAAANVGEAESLTHVMPDMLVAASPSSSPTRLKGA